MPYKKKSTLIYCLDKLSRRISALIAHSFDLDLPLEVDDEYFESPNPALAFKQPPNKPARVAYFAAATKMSRILGYALRTIVRFIFHISNNRSLLCA